MVGFVIRLMNLEHMQVPVDGLSQAELLDEQMDQPDATIRDGVVAVSNVVIDVARREGRPRAGRGFLFVKPAFNSGLELAEPAAENRFHSKSFRGRWRL